MRSGTAGSRMLVISAVSMLLMHTAVLAGQFEFDPAEKTVSAKLLANEHFYDADCIFVGDTVYLTWLEFVPGSGDQLWIAQWQAGQVERKASVLDQLIPLKYPTLTRLDDERLLLSYEYASRGRWRIAARVIDLERFEVAPPTWHSPLNVNAINHAVAGNGDGALWLAWQAAHGDQFVIMADMIEQNMPADPVIVSFPLEGNHWTPDITLDAAGQLYVVWDGYDGKSYNVYARCRTSQQWNPILAVAATSTFEGRAEVAAAGDGRAWVLWEEGAVNWGDVYTSKMRKAHSESIKWNDVKGPLHRHRALRLGLLSVDGSFSHVQPEIPMPSFAKAAERADAPAAVEKFGVYYERGKLTVDQGGCPWVSYRHRYVPYLGISKTSHTDEGWRVYTRRFTDQGWSPVSVFDIGQGDGMQRLASAASEDRGIAVWTTGRTDRRDNESPRGVAIATWQIEPADAPDRDPQTQLETLSEQPPAAHQPVVRDQSPEGPRIFKEIDGTRYELLFGDLHRHTDLSLCYVPADGSIEDAYRYGCDAADLDFMSITDHARDIAQGNALSLLWWRNIKQVGRHTLEPSFLPMVGYERSRGGEDHNVISLRDDVLRPHTYPHWEFWKELDTDTITIPHQTNTAPIPEGGPMPYGLNKKTWKHQNDTLRPLLEIYQGCRDRSIERDAHRAFQMGNMLGFIASSDHLSTSHSYAGVWVRNRDRESIMRAMQARRTFGATNKMQLEVTADEMWMGSHLGNRRWPEVQIHIVGTAEIEQVEVLLDGKIVHTFEPASAEAALTYQPPTVADGTHFLYVRVRQVDGHQGWSSPMWVSPGMNAAKAR